jgi:hypothetical protein
MEKIDEAKEGTTNLFSRGKEKVGDVLECERIEPDREGMKGNIDLALEGIDHCVIEGENEEERENDKGNVLQELPVADGRHICSLFRSTLTSETDSTRMNSV